MLTRYFCIVSNIQTKQLLKGIHQNGIEYQRKTLHSTPAEEIKKLCTEGRSHSGYRHRTVGTYEITNQ